jgi:hypothetical protein
MSKTGIWRKSSRSSHNGSCVQARLSGAIQQVGDSKLGAATPALDGFEALRATILAGFGKTRLRS